jgi:hypothetical protein
MSKLNIAGGLCLVGAFMLLLFQAISSQMVGNQGGWKNLSMELVIGSKYFDWVNSISIDMVYKCTDYVVTMPLYILLAILGVIFFLMGSFLWK